MTAGADRLRVHLFVVFDRPRLRQSIELQLLGDLKGSRGRLKRPRVLSEILPGDYAVVWLNVKSDKLVGVWRVVEARENIDPTAWGGRFPVQARVVPVTEHINEIGHQSFIMLLEPTPGKKEDIYDGTQAEAILNLFGVTASGTVTCNHNLPNASGPMTPPTTRAITPQNQDPAARHDRDYRPPFFDKMLQTTDWAMYEDYVHALLRSLGIHKLFPILRSDQAGRSDGLFTIGNLAVIYDATLNSNIEGVKGQQIQNYIADLQRGFVSIPPNHTEPISGTATKRVWIIVRSATRLIGSVGDVKVCHVNVEQLMSLFEKRIANSMASDDLVDELARIGT